jgi:hypothetical protein
VSKTWQSFTGVFIVLCVTLPAYAGDLMNVEFLQKHAILSDGELQRLSQELAASQEVKMPSAGQFFINAIANGLFTATYFIPGTVLNQAVAVGAGGLFHYPMHSSYLSDKKGYKQNQLLVKAITNRTDDLNALVEALYYDWQKNMDVRPERSNEARESLVKLTNQAVVSEVDINLKLESMVKTQRDYRQPDDAQTYQLVKAGNNPQLRRSQIKIKEELVNKDRSQSRIISVNDIGVAPLAFMKPLVVESASAYKVEGKRDSVLPMSQVRVSDQVKQKMLITFPDENLNHE